MSRSNYVAPHHHLIDKVAVLNAVISSLALYPQLYILLTRGFAPHSVSGISYALILCNNIIWFFYGRHLKNFPLVISSVLSAIAAGVILFIVYK